MVWADKLMEAKPISEHSKEIRQLAKEFESWQKILLALGDETRQHLILEMMKMEDCGVTGRN